MITDPETHLLLLRHRVEQARRAQTLQLAGRPAGVVRTTTQGTTMSRLPTLLVAVATGVLVLAAPASAAVTEPGLPGDPACAAGTRAWLAQGGTTDTHGLGGLAHATGGDEADPFDVQDVHGFVAEWCSRVTTG